MKPAKKDLSSFSREELEARIHQLEAYNFQLKNIASKSTIKNSNNRKREENGKQRPFDFSSHNKRHILLKIAYLGWDHQGLASQDHTENTIEAALFNALHTTKLIQSRESSNYQRCGRTDKGVSAFSQVVSLTVRSGIPVAQSDVQDHHSTDLEDLKKEINYPLRLNKVLPREIRVLAWSPAPEGFSARFDCTKRTYKYFFPRANLDLEAMRTAATDLIGEHDYRNLCKMNVGSGVVNFKRKILDVSIQEVDPQRNAPSEEKSSKLPPTLLWEEGYKMCEATVVGVAFLWHQIRAIMTVLLLIGEGKEKPDIVEKLLDVNTVKRKPQYGIASDIGLILYNCQYENVSWVYDEQNLAIVIAQFQDFWREHAVKCCMLHAMLSDLSSTFKEHFPASSLPAKQADCNQDSGCRKYTPLLKRQTCESLENRVRQYVKCQRLDPSFLEKIETETVEEKP